MHGGSYTIVMITVALCFTAMLHTVKWFLLHCHVLASNIEINGMRMRLDVPCSSSLCVCVQRTVLIGVASQG